MAKYSNKYDLLKVSDSEISDFFKTACFTGVFDYDIPEEQKQTFCGKITNIAIDGENNDLCSPYIYVPNKFKTFVRPGNCEFYCSVNIDKLRDEKHLYRLFIYRIKNSVLKEARSFDTVEENLFKRNLKLRNNLFIGQFTQNKDGSFAFRDIRRSDFSKLILQNGKEQSPIVYHPKTKKPDNGKYYEFSWVLNSVNKNEYVYNFKVDETKPFKEIIARDVIDKLHASIMDYSADAGQKIVKMLDTLKNQLTASGKEIFIYELLQNANDYPNKNNNLKEKVDVEFHITQSSLVFLHSGAEFNERNIAAICSINDKEKTDNKDTIGYKGIGFKTVFLDNNYVYLQTGNFSFRFDREYSRDIVDTPWQILPIWTKYNELSPAEKYIFTNADNKFRVKFALRPTNIRTLRESPQNYVKMFKEVFRNERVILFIPNLTSVKVFFNGTPVPDIECRCDSKHWQVDDFEELIPDSVTETINADINEQEDTGSLKIPTKYYDFTKTKVSFACEIDGASLKEVTDTQLYCYLPTKASWGFNFLMNTDMIPTGPRDDIEIDFSEQININAEISEIAGFKFFDWIKKLSDLKKFKLNSIFDLIPVFETCITQHGKYKALISRFKVGFEKKLRSEELIPINSTDYCLLNNLILDETGFTSSGIMDDAVFYKITGLNGYLPIKILRTDRNFKSFVRRYLKEFENVKNIWDFDELRDLCSVPEMQEWLKVQDNNNRFLDFLLKKGELDNFLDEALFLSSKGELCCASYLYYDVDEYLEDLQAFSHFLPYLSLQTRVFFKDNDEWKNVIDGKFEHFDADDFVDKKLLSTANIADTKKALGDKDASVHFYKFLAENVGYSEAYKSLPFFDDNNVAVFNFLETFVFLSSEKGHNVCNQQWMKDIPVSFLSKDYKDVTKKYFSENFGVRNYSDDIIVKEVILSNDYQPTIDDSITDIDISKEFIKYCFDNKDFIDMGDLKGYNLHVYDGNGDGVWALYDANIFFQSPLYYAYSAKEWIDSGWMYVLDEDYFSGITDKKTLKEFFKQKFYVSELTEESFYVHIVKENLPKIIKATCGSEDRDGKKNIDFILYLDENYKMIFEDKRDADKFHGFKPVSNDILDLNINNNVYVYDEELAEIANKDWFPKDTIYLCNKEVEKSPSLIALGCSKYNFSSFYTDVIVEEISSINDTISTKEQSLAFHTFIIDNLRYLTVEQQGEMIKAKVYLYGNDTPANSAKGHKILSAKAKELFEQGLVEFSDLDIIDPIYKTEENTEYWETRLGNSKFNITHFFSWLKDNTETFSNTLQDKEKNIVFWRWLKENANDKAIGEIPVIPIILKDGNIDNSDEVVYFSDEYMGGAGIESSVKRFDPDAPFISPEYLAEGDDVEEWKVFWTKTGIKYEIIDILTETIIPSLSEIEDESLPKLIAENREALEKYYENGLISELTGLKVKAYDGEFYTLDETIYIDCEKDEPFPYIEIPNQINFNTADERRLIKDVIEEVGGDCVSKLSEWQQRKMDCYLSMQKDNPDSVRNFHFRFINDLSKIRNNEKDTLKEIEHIKEIKLLNRNNEFCEASSLTMGSAYNPFFDFEGCGVETNYVSNQYNEECFEYAGRLFRTLDIHCDFKELDVDVLKNRECAVYFWSKYLTRKDISISRIKDIIDKNLLNDLPCIPTKDLMKSPKELYYGVEVSRYVKYIEDWENKIPLTVLPDIKQSDGATLFDELPFKKSLDFLDGLYALISVIGQDRRTQILEWMIEDYDESYDEKIAEYREDEHAFWNNNKNEQVQIKELYALNYAEKPLEQYFGQNPRIVNKAYFPGGISFKTACDILNIKTISLSDLKMEPQGDIIFNQRNNDLKLFALVIAGMIDTEGWQELYKGYLEKLESLVLHRCESIMITYKEDETINQSLRKFYHETGSNDFYFVDSLDGKRVYTLFVKEFTDFIGIGKDDIPQEMIEDIMDSRTNALELIREQNTLMLDDAFKDALDQLIPGIKRKLNGNKAEDDDEENVDYRPTFTTTDSNCEDDDGLETIDTEKKSDADEDYEQTSDEGYEVDDTTNRTSNIGNSRTEPQVLQSPRQEETNSQSTSAQSDDDNVSSGDSGTIHTESQTKETGSRKTSSSTTANQTPHISSSTTPKTRQPREPQDHFGAHNNNNEPREWTTNDIERIKAKGVARCLSEGDAEPIEIEQLNTLLGSNMSAEEIADTNYLAQMRLYQNLVKYGDEPEENLEDFVKSNKTEHSLSSGKYIHKCSAKYGIVYISPSIWNKVASGRCVVCVYLGKRAKDFMYLRSIDDILKWVHEDDILIKLTGEDKVDIVNTLYSGVLDGITGTAYTMIRIASNAIYNPVFAQLMDDPNQEDSVDDF